LEAKIFVYISFKPIERAPVAVHEATAATKFVPLVFFLISL
jgi:hypothetical protein